MTLSISRNGKQSQQTKDIPSRDTQSIGQPPTFRGEVEETGGSLTPSDQEKVSTAIGIDWLTTTFNFPNRERFDQFLKGIYQGEPYCHLELPCKLSADKFYPYSLRSQMSADGGYSIQKEESGEKNKHRDQVRGGYEVNECGNYVGFIQLKGKYWERLTPSEQLEIISHCENYRCDYSRIDVRMDDWSHELLPLQEMREAWKRGDIAGFKKSGYNEEGTPDDLKWRYSFGGRKSESYIRGYNHDWGEDEKFENRESHRLEVEFKGKKAKEVVRQLASLKSKVGSKPNEGIWKGMIQIEVGDRVFCKPENDGWGRVLKWDEFNECFQVELDSGKEESYYPSQLQPTREEKTWEQEISDYLANLVVGQIDFVNKSEKIGKRVNKKDCERLAFWQEFLDKVEQGIKIVATRKRTSLEKNREWLERQVAASLSVYYEGLGESEFMGFISYLIAYGKEKWKDTHEMMADAVASDLNKGMSYI
jgi:uncharacterized protein YeaO (DUF488 family)